MVKQLIYPYFALPEPGGEKETIKHCRKLARRVSREQMIK
jgi:hypothetical protein